MNAKIYTGRKGNVVHGNLAKDVVMELCEPLFNSDSKVVSDNVFTTHSLAVSLLQRHLTLLGTTRRQRAEVPVELRNTRRPVELALFVDDYENHIVLTSYILNLNLSHVRNKVEAGNVNKPQMIIDYNHEKKGVDQIDENVEEYTCRRKTVRWPLSFLLHLM